MPNRFEVPDDESPPPSTPDRGRRGQNYYDDGPSTTPAGPPPSSAMTFTPAGDPSASYLHSSLMQGFTNPKPLNFGKPTSGNASRRPLGNSQLGRSIRGSQPKERARSGLSRTLAVENEEDAEGDYGEDPPDGAEDAGDVEEDASGEDDDMYDGDGAQSAEFLSKEPDLLFATPAANERVRKEAEDIYRASTMRSTMGGARRREFKFDTVARDLYSRIPHADLTEPADVILGTEYLVNRLYDEGVGPEDDAERLDTALAMVSGALVDLWNGYVGTLPPPEEEHAAEIGPSPHAEPFEHAFFLSNVVLQLRHSRNPPSPSSSRLGGSVGSGRGLQTPPLPATLFDWLRTSHNLYPDQLRDVERHLPNPVAHALYWPTVFTSLIRGDVPGAIRLLRAADWSVVKKGAAAGGGRRAEQAYTGRTLDNVRRAVQDTADMLALCPAAKAATPAAGVSSTAAGAAAAAAWDIWTEDWVMFRVQARGARDRLTRFVEGKDQLRSQASRDSPSADAGSFTSLARRAESQVPWEVYENLQTVYEIVMGRPNAIMTAAQDWCEATVGLCAWADEQRELHLDSDKSRDKRALQLARDAAAAGDVEATERYFDRLARCFHTVVGSEFHFNPMNPVEVGIACVFEGNYEAVIGFLRAWSLPVASAVAEIGSLGRWLPRGGLSASSASLKALLPAVEDLDMEDLEVLGMGDVAAAAGAAASPEDVDGVKDHTLICYARSLAAIDELRVSTTTSPVASFGAAKPVPLESRSGWEVAVHVLGRMDSPERSEELVGELIHSILEKVDLDSSATVDKIWTLLNLLGMINFAEEAAETFADILARDSHRYGEALWYYALAHKANKVREILNLLISYSLIQSTAYPSMAELDDKLRALLTDRKATLEDLAKKDLEAAELLGTTLSGYATLRRFYELRDEYGKSTGPGGSSLPPRLALLKRRRVAVPLIAVLVASCDSIRGGLYDSTRDTTVSPDFVLALLGEASVFLSSSSSLSDDRSPSTDDPTAIVTSGPGALTLAHVDALLKAVEDAATITGRVRAAAEDFFSVVLAAAPGGLKGSTPTDLLRRTTSTRSSGSTTTGTGSFMLTGSSMLASQLQRSMSGPSSGASVARGWDWRSGLVASQASSADVLRRLRVGLARELARLWIAQADDVLV